MPRLTRGRPAHHHRPRLRCGGRRAARQTRRARHDAAAAWEKLKSIPRVRRNPRSGKRSAPRRKNFAPGRRPKCRVSRKLPTRRRTSRNVSQRAKTPPALANSISVSQSRRDVWRQGGGRAARRADGGETQRPRIACRAAPATAHPASHESGPRRRPRRSRGNAQKLTKRAAARCSRSFPTIPMRATACSFPQPPSLSPKLHER